MTEDTEVLQSQAERPQAPQIVNQPPTKAFRGRPAEVNPSCVVCGSGNPRGMHIAFQLQADAVCADWIPSVDWESFPGTIHGGIITTVLDEAMSKAILARQWQALTVDLRVRFRGRVAPGEKLQIRGWVIERQKRRILAEASVQTATGEERAHAWATFLAPPPS